MKYINAKKSLGQNFLADTNMASKIVRSADLEISSIVIEIGPGTGLLTEHIVESADNITLVEIDQRAIELLNDKYEKSTKNIKVIHQDFREFDFKTFYEQYNQKAVVIGNIPYYITGDIFFKLFENANYIDRAIITLQKEVGQRIVAKKNTKDYGILTIAANYSSIPKYLFDIPAQCFIPKPNVTSAVVRLDFKDNFDNCVYKKLMKIVKKSFNQRRKMLSNTVGDLLGDDFDTQIWNKYKSKRPEDLELLDFLELLSICRD